MDFPGCMHAYVCSKAASDSDCQIFLGTTYQNWENIYQIAIKYTKGPQNIPNSHKIDQVGV
jgi:hypothetical protein